MGRSQGISHTTINRIWQIHNIKPHLTKTYKVSRDAKFTEKLTDVVGLYLNLPDNAVVLCVDEKSQIQALDRTQPVLPLKKGDAVPCRMTTSATVPLASLLLSMLLRGKLPASATQGIVTRSS